MQKRKLADLKSKKSRWRQKPKAAAEAKQKTATQQQSKTVDSLLDGLMADGNKQLRSCS